MMSDELEIWLGDEGILLALNSSFAPTVGDLINIRKKTYCVVARNFAVDHADEWDQRHVRCAVTVEFQQDDK